tara:strand:+ start:110 stop:829 length:720 start_codon:yes stop_codon:yes gene_type:complete
MSDNRKLRLSKIAGMTTTQPLYETSDGKEFTISDIVQGKIKPPKKYKSKSLSYRYRLKKKKSDLNSGMIKRSYSSGKPDEYRPVKNMPVINNPPAPEPYVGFIVNDIGGFGDAKDNEDFDVLTNNIDDLDKPSFDLTNYLIDLSNKLDKNKKVKSSNFIDYLIVKSADKNDIDYSNAFNDLILKINESDIDMKNNFIKKIANKFSRLVNIAISKGSDINDAKMMSYKECLVAVEMEMKS